MKLDEGWFVVLRAVTILPLLAVFFVSLTVLLVEQGPVDRLLGETIFILIVLFPLFVALAIVHGLIWFAGRRILAWPLGTFALGLVVGLVMAFGADRLLFDGLLVPYGVLAIVIASFLISVDTLRVSRKLQGEPCEEGAPA